LSETLSRAVHAQFPNFQIHFVERTFLCSGRLDQFGKHIKLPSLLEKVASELCGGKMEECTHDLK